MYLADYHTHTHLSMDGKFPLSAMARRAIRRGIQEICVTDHCDLLDQNAQRVYGYPWSLALEQYRSAAIRYQNRLIIRLGLEFGMGHLDPEVSDEILSIPELDFVIGSVHNFSPEKGGADLFYQDFSSRAACAEALDDYFESMAKLAASPYYDVLGHISYPLRYMKGQVTIRPWLDQITEILRTAVEQGKGIELNTYRGQTVAEWKPILERYRRVGGDLITVGSDAHDLSGLGVGVAKAYELLRTLGFRFVTTYYRRRPRMIPIY